MSALHVCLVCLALTADIRCVQVMEALTLDAVLARLAAGELGVVCPTCLPYMSALYVCLICLPYMSGLLRADVLRRSLGGLPYMSA